MKKKKKTKFATKTIKPQNRSERNERGKPKRRNRKTTERIETTEKFKPLVHMEESTDRHTNRASENNKWQKIK